ncbi:MAG: hypothetical protein GX561_07285 [Lentisphaerae bacterium]|jgi:hypothetical protein|nr:hypothetical protein [Lentisphaerota bacterium]
MRRVACLIFALSMGLLCAADFRFEESFSGDVPELWERGWRALNKSLVSQVDDVVQVKAESGERNFLLHDIEVEPGEVYGGRVRVKSLGVVARNNGDRGVTLFFGFLSEKKDWINGGEFPKGPFAAGDWQDVEIGMTIPIPEEVKYIQVWIGVEGQGTAQFKDFEMHKVDMSSHIEVDASVNPPRFKYTAPVEYKTKNERNRFFITLGRDREVDESKAFVTSVQGAGGEMVFPHSLEPGKWYMKAFWMGKGKLKPIFGEFDIAQLPENVTYLVKQDFPNGKHIRQGQTLKVTFYPALRSDPKITLDGKDVKILKRTEDMVEFTPVEPLDEGLKHVQVKVGSTDKTFVYVNKNPAHRFDFRDDKMLMIDGKPFFPIGTYRDPSDDKMVFDGIMEAGFNTTHSYDFEHKVHSGEAMRSYLQECEKRNLKVFLGIPRSYLLAEDGDSVMAHCAEVYSEPALLTYYLADEPEIWLNYRSFRILADAVKSATPGVPRTVLLCRFGFEPGLTAYLDGHSEIHWHDPYPVPRTPVSSVKTRMETSREMSGGKQAVWCVVQAFDWDQQAVRDKRPEDVEPKAGKIRCMAHLALTAKVTGLIFYWLPKDRYDMKIHSPVQWAEVCSTVKELNGLLEYLTGRHVELDLKLPEGIYHWCKRSDDGKQALGLVNSLDKPMEVKVDIPGFAKTIVLPPYGVDINRF